MVASLLTAHLPVDIGVVPSSALQHMVWGVGMSLFQKAFLGFPVP